MMVLLFSSNAFMLLLSKIFSAILHDDASVSVQDALS